MAIDTRETATTGPSGVAVGQRIIGLGFGLIQLLIVGRIVLLFLDARTTNGIVSGILNLSQVFVAPFEGILRTNSLTASGSVLDVAAVVALVGWTVAELIVVSVLAVFGREPA
jgi:YGGT family